MRPRPPGHSDPSPRGFRGQRGSGARTGLRVAVGPGPVIPLLTLCFFSGLHRPNPALIRCLPAHQRLWGSSQEVRISGPRGILENRSLVSRVHLLQKAALTAAPECHASLSHSPWSLMTRGIASCMSLTVSYALSPWRRKWQPLPVSLPRGSRRQSLSLVRPHGQSMDPHGVAKSRTPLSV